MLEQVHTDSAVHLRVFAHRELSAAEHARCQASSAWPVGAKTTRFTLPLLSGYIILELCNFGSP